MSSEEEFVGLARVDVARLRVWLDEGWIVPSRIGGKVVFRDVDVARAALIRDLDVLMGVNDEGIGVILGLVDQLHMLRRDFDTMVEALKATGVASDRSREGAAPDGRDPGAAEGDVPREGPRGGGH